MDRHSPYVATLNFHGVTLKHAFPVIAEVHHTQWSVQVDIADAPDLVLVPRRSTAIPRSTISSLRRRAIFSVIYAEPLHRLSFEDWLEARFYSDDFLKRRGNCRSGRRPPREVHRRFGSPISSRHHLR